MRELLAIALMIAATALLIKWGSWLLSNIDEALDTKTPASKSRGGDGAIGEAGAGHSRDALHNSRPRRSDV